MNERILSMVGAAPQAHPHPGCSPALGGLQFCCHLVLTELPHGESSQCLVCPGDCRAPVGDQGLSPFWSPIPKPQGREERFVIPLDLEG